MRSPFYFIITPHNSKRYDNTKDIGGVNFITSSSTEDHRFSNRYANVIETPIGYNGNIQKGDTLLVHHNVFKYYYDMRGRERSGRSFLKDDYLFVDEEQFFLYKHDDPWKSHSKYCFIKPLEEQDYYLEKFTKEEPLVGTIRYINEDLLNLGLKIGDKICYQPDSEYEFLVDGEKLYRMFTNNITVKLNEIN
jgi:hypothetical protein